MHGQQNIKISIFVGRCSDFQPAWQEVILKYCLWHIRDYYGYFK